MCYLRTVDIPGISLTKPSYSEWGLRQGAAACGVPVSHAQFKSYRACGLIQEADEYGRWPAATIDQLIDVRLLEPALRPLPRRVLWLRSNYLQFPVPAVHIRRAMLAMLPTIAAPVRKMRRVRTAQLNLASVMGGTIRRARREVPDTADWSRLLSDADEVFFESCVHPVYRLPIVLAAYSIEPPGVPLEEHVTLAMLLRLYERDIALRQNRSMTQTT